MTVSNTQNKQTKIPVTMRGLAILQIIAEAPHPLSINNIMQHTNLPKSTIHRILQQLTESEMIYKESLNNRFFLSQKTQHLAHNILTNNTYHGPRHRLLKNLSNLTGETCNCTFFDGDSIVYFDRVETNWSIRIQLPIGSKLPVHCTASGKLFLAYMPKAIRQRLLNVAPLERYSQNTTIDVSVLEQEFKKIKAQGYSTDQEEYLAGVVSIAMPVFIEGKLYFTVAIHTPVIRKTISDLKRLLPQLKDATTSIAELYKKI